MPPRVILDHSAILNGMTPVPQRGSIIWHWMQTRAVQAITSDCLVIELTRNLADPKVSPRRRGSGNHSRRIPAVRRAIRTCTILGSIL